MNGKQLKNSILQWAIQGKLVPQDPNDEPASVLLERIRKEKEQLVKEKKIKKDKNASIIFRGEDNSYYEKFLATGEVKCIDEEIPIEIPQGWEWERWGNISQSIQYGYNAPALDNGDIRMVRISDIQNNKVLWENVPFCLINTSEIETYLLKVNDILFARTGGTVGKSFLVEEVPMKAIYAGYLIRTRYSSLLCPYYMKAFMESQLYWEQLKNGTIATAQPNCNGKTLANMLLPIPPINEQKRIVEKLRNVSRHIEHYGKSQDSLNQLNEQVKEQLKKSILQEAIQGKLVPQISEEGISQELLEQIRQEKKKLVKEGKLKKSALNDSVIFKGDDNKYYEQIGTKCIDISESIPFEVPIGWCWTRLSVISNLYTGNSISETEKATRYTNVQGMEYIGTKDVSFNHIVNYANGIAIPNEHISQFKIAPSRSVLLCIEGGSAGRKIAQIEKNVCFGNKLCCFVPYMMDISEYIYCYLQSPSFFENFRGNLAGIIGGVSVNTLKSLLIPLPPIEEQKRIVAQIEKLFEKLK